MDTDSEEEVPSGWEERLADDGRVYYACHDTKTTQWEHPVSGRKKKVTAELPYGWERKVSTTGQVFYFNWITLKMTHVDPRLVFATEDKPDNGEVRQRFDASSTALHVLHGIDLTGQCAIVTGANSGIGYEMACSLALHGAHVILACRNMKEAQICVHKIRQQRNMADVEAQHIDLKSLASVQQFAQCFLARNITLHMLILNAGVFSLPYSVTEDGYETTFQTNHLGHFHLTQLLLPALQACTTGARVTVVTCESHRFTDLNEHTICESQLSPPVSRYRAILAYNQSKLCNALFAQELHRRYSTRGVYCNAVHPGNVIATGITRNWWLWRLLFNLVRPFAKSKQQGAATPVFCATARELDGISGYYFNHCFKCPLATEAYNTETARLLWDLSEVMVYKAQRRSEANKDTRNVIDM